MPWLREERTKKRLLLVLVLSVAALLVLLSTVGGVAVANAAEPGTPEPASLEGSQALVPAPTGLLEEVIVTRPAAPTATPGRIEQQVEELVETVGLARTTFLGLSLVDWSSLAICLLFVLSGCLAQRADALSHGGKR